MDTKELRKLNMKELEEKAASISVEMSNYILNLVQVNQRMLQN